MTSGPEAQLHEAGLRITAVRLAVLKAVSETPHADVETLGKQARARLGSVSTQAVYDALRVLSEAGLVRRIAPQGSPTRYETRVDDNHHHVVCRKCQAVADIDCMVGAAPCLTPQETHGYLIDEAEITFWGLCPNCQEGARSAGTDIDSSDTPTFE